MRPFGRAPAPAEKGGAGAGASRAGFLTPPAPLVFVVPNLQGGAAPPGERLVGLQ